MRRILILTHEFPPFCGGVAAVAHGLASGAAALGYDTHVLAPAYDCVGSDCDAERPYEITRFPGAACSVLSIDKLAKFTKRCRREVALRKPDIVHAVDAPAQMALTALSRLRMVRRYFFTVHGTELLRYRNDTVPRLWMLNAFRRVTCTSVVSRRVLDILVSSFEVPQDRAFVSYSGIDPLWSNTPLSDQAPLRKRLGIGPEDIVLLTVARRVPAKGHRRVIDGLAALPPSIRERVTYVVVGTGPEDYARGLARVADSASVRLELLGALTGERLLAVYDAADVFIMLSEGLEAFGLVHIEAAARGVPSIACDTGGVPEAVADRDTGIVLPHHPNPDQVGQAVARLAKEPRLRERMGTRARELASSYTWQRNAAEVYGRFSEALAQPGKGVYRVC